MKTISDIMPPMAQKPRITIEIYNPDINYELKKIAINARTTIRYMVLSSLAQKYPQLAELIGEELKRGFQ